MSICKKLVKICPECLKAYVMLRTETLKNGKALETTDDGENDENEKLVVAFNDADLSDEDFEKMLDGWAVVEKTVVRRCGATVATARIFFRMWIIVEWNCSTVATVARRVDDFSFLVVSAYVRIIVYICSREMEWS